MRLVILGMGGYGRTVADVADQTGRYEEIVFLDDQAEQAFDVCDAYRKYVEEDTEMYPAFGNNELRVAWMDKLKEAKVSIATIVHPLAYVSPRAVLRSGCVLEQGVHVAPGAVVKAENRIPAYTKVDSGVVIQNRSYPL